MTIAVDLGRKATKQTNKPMEFPLQFDNSYVRMFHYIYCGVTGYNFPKYIAFLTLKIVCVLAKSADPDEMLLYAAFHPSLHCL